MELESTVAASGPPRTGASSEVDEALARGSAVGRYLVLFRLGAGAMGVVYAAHDPELDRKVALKLVLPESAGGSEQGRVRLLREAQALAKLAHPNVVAIHDVGVHGEQVWLAMEFIDGRTLTAWLGERRGWPEVLRVMTAAGAGLAAAHAAGLLHRDFKPDNVMIGGDGRVRVMDFGLARTKRDAPPIEEAIEGSIDTSHLALAVTHAGAVMGTPAYMSPEQFRGQEVGVRSDVFSFAVATWQALYGARPYAGDNMIRLAANVLQGKREPIPSGVAVPTWLRRTLERGFATDPAQRWPTMEALLHALERGRLRARRRSAVIAALAVAVVALIVVGYFRWDLARREVACEAAGAAIDQVWNDGAREGVRGAFTATGVPYAKTTADKVLPLLDERAATWRRERTEVCRNATILDRWSDDLAERAEWCLEDQYTVLEALVGQFKQATATNVDNAVSAVVARRPIGACLDEPRLRRQPEPPTEGREALKRARAGLAKARSSRFVGNREAALAALQEVHELASAQIDWPPISAAARAEEAFLAAEAGTYDKAEALGVEAYFAAVRAGAWEVAASAANHLIFTVGYRLKRHAEGRAWARHAEMAILYAGDPMDVLEAERINSLATVEQSAGDYATALTHTERALAIWERAFGPDYIWVAAALNNLAVIKRHRGEYAEARPVQERALAIRERTLGPDHPDVALSLSNLAQLSDLSGDPTTARGLYERALAIRERALGPEHRDVAANLNSLAGVLKNLGEYARAQERAEQALRIREKAGADESAIAGSLMMLAEIHRALREHARALALDERALTIRRASLGPDHPGVATNLNNLGEDYLGIGETTEARAALEQALAIRERTLGENHPFLALTLGNLGLCDLADRRPQDALPRLERAVTIFASHEGVQEGELEARFALARALVAGGGDPGRAVAEAAAARDGLSDAGPGQARLLAEVEAWLTKHSPHRSP